MSVLVPGDPRQLGQYALAGRLGEGGQGVVYEGYGPAGQRVAIKVLHPGAGAELRRRFAKEVEATRSVSQFCTARVLAVELDGARPYIVSEYVAGPSLRRAVETGGPYGMDDLYRLATGVATALTAIHEAGVIHRDLKPDNVLIGPDGPRVIDFGIARTSEMSLTPTGQVAGTPAFMAPESVVGQRAGPAVDVWAWGAVVLYAATGREPFRGDNMAALLHQILAAEPDASALAEPLRSLVTSAMAKDPDDRPPARRILLALVGAEADLLAEGSRAAGALRPPGQAAPPLGELAERVYAGLPPREQDVVPRMLLRMVGADGAPRPVRDDELLDGAVGAQTVGRVLGGFLRAELLSRDGEEVTLASAALVKAWPRMREWVESDADGLRLHQELTEVARRWDANGRRPGDLYTGTSLETALSWAATGRHHVTLNLVENAFLTASVALSRVRSRRRRQITVVLAGLLVVAVAATGVAVDQRATAERQRDVAAAALAASRADELRATDPVTAMLLSVAAWRLDPGGDVRPALYSSLAQPERRVYRGPPVAADAHADLGADGRTVAVASGGAAVLWDAVAGRRVGGANGLGAGVELVALSPDGHTVAVAGPGSLRLWDLRTGAPMGHAFGQGARLLRFSGDGRTLAAVTYEPRAELWRVSDRTLVKAWRDPGVDGLSVSDDGGTAAVTYLDGRYALWDVAKDHALKAPLGGRGESVSFLSDGSVAVAGRAEVSVWDLGTGERRGPALAQDDVSAVWRTPSGLLLTCGPDAIGLWRPDGWRWERLLDYRPADASGLPAVHLDGGTLRFLVAAGALAELDVSALTGPGAYGTGMSGAAFSADGQVSALLGDKGVEVRGAHPGRIDVPGAHAVAVSPDGATIAVGGARSVTLWHGGRARTIPVGQGDSVDGLAFGPGGNLLAVAPWRGGWDPLLLMDTATGRTRTLARIGDLAMAFGADGRSLAVGGNESGVADLVKGLGPRLGSAVDEVLSVAFSPDGGVVAAGVRGTGVRLWNASDGRALGALPGTQGEAVTALAFSPDGRTLAVGDEGGLVGLWDVTRRLRLGLPYAAHSGSVLALAFGRDGVRSAGQDGVVRAYPIDETAAAKAVCRRAGTTLSPQEWQRLIPEAPYREVCS
ncbi:protein kinase [Streptosporangiaceae bacterium NEAU-GS5]|nr:protein kinase [Streptosporangiaceae bacterium NEAU-GS5]